LCLLLLVLSVVALVLAGWLSRGSTILIDLSILSTKKDVDFGHCSLFLVFAVFHVCNGLFFGFFVIRFIHFSFLQVIFVVF
jgi:hypothetical protein